MVCCVTFHPLCKLSDYADVGTALGPTVTVGMLAGGPSVSQMLLLPVTRVRSTEVKSRDGSNHGSVVSVTGAAQTLARPSPLVYGPTKAPAAKARSALAVRAVVHSDVLWVLTFYQAGCGSVSSWFEQL